MREIEPEVLDHIVLEFGEQGLRAVEFVRTARPLLSDAGSDAPRQPAAVAYCLREAMKAIPNSEADGEGGEWRTLSRAVTDARRRYEMVRGIPGAGEEQALSELLAAADGLASFHECEEGVHERRLIAIMLRRTGSMPLSAGTAPVRSYQALLRRLDKCVHADINLEQSVQLWDDCVATLRHLFMPSELRRSDLNAWSAIADPSEVDLTELTNCLASPNDLRYFLGRVRNPNWLPLLLPTGLLEPPSDGGWTFFAAIPALSGEHADATAAPLGRLNDMHGRDPRKAWLIGRAAVDLGESSLDLVTAIVGEHRGNASIAHLATMSAEHVPATHPAIEILADILLNPESWEAHGAPADLCERLAHGINEGNWAKRVQLLAFKITKGDQLDNDVLAYDRSGSIADVDPYGQRDRMPVLTAGLLGVLQAAIPFASTDDLLALLSGLPAPLLNRVHAWLLTLRRDEDVQSKIDFIAASIATREPTGDDLRLIDAINAEIDDSDKLMMWGAALGPSPSVADAAASLHEDAVPLESRRALEWIGILPASTSASWTTAASILATKYGLKSRGLLARRDEPIVGWGRSPIDKATLETMSPHDAATHVSEWRPDGTEWLVSARELARTLKTVVSESPSAWATAPIAIATTLREPIYMSHYLEGLTSADWPPDGNLDQVLDLITLVHAEPWRARELGSDKGWDYDPDWRSSKQASIELLKKLANQDIDLGDRADEAWAHVASAARDRSSPSGLISDGRDPMETAINRDCTRAFETAIAFIAHEYRQHAVIREDALALADEALELPGLDGEEYRAILAPRLGFFRHAAPDWFASRQSMLFGDEAPEGLARTTLDLCLKWGQPQHWLLAEHRIGIFDAVERGVNHALEYALIAMVHRVDGYEPRETLTRLVTLGPVHVSAAGERLGRLLRVDDPTPALIDVAAEFWSLAIHTSAPAALSGFGWMSEVSALDDPRWSQLTLATLTRTTGQIDWAHHVAERAAKLPSEIDRAAILNLLVRAKRDDWDQRMVIDIAVQVHNCTEDDLPEHRLLKKALLERGAI